MDDATGTVPDALFSQEEDTRGYFLLMEGLIRRCGMPLAVYSDRHAVFKHTGEVGRKPGGPTQFARALEELGIRQIFARSPQAKGRVERTAGTFQDRLVTELRLAGVTTIDEANAVLHRFLPRFNEKFGVPAEHSSVAYRPMCQWRRDIRPWGVDGQRKCPPKWSAKMSLELLAMVSGHSVLTVGRFIGGLSACMYFFAVSRWMASSRATLRIDRPLRFAFCTAFHLAV